MMNLDVNDLTIGELLIFEDVTGKPITSMGDSPGARELQALALIFLRRENPDATPEDALAVKVSAFASDGTEDPTETTE